MTCVSNCRLVELGFYFVYVINDRLRVAKLQPLAVTNHSDERDMRLMYQWDVFACRLWLLPNHSSRTWMWLSHAASDAVGIVIVHSLYVINPCPESDVGWLTKQIEQIISLVPTVMTHRTCARPQCHAAGDN